MGAVKWVIFSNLWCEYAATFLRDFGVAVHFAAVMALISIPACLAFDEPVVAPALLACAVPMALGQPLFHRVRAAEAMRVRRAKDRAALAWIAISFIGLRDIA